MKKVVLFSVLLITGLVLPRSPLSLLGSAYGPLKHLIRMLPLLPLNGEDIAEEHHEAELQLAQLRAPEELLAAEQQAHG